MALWKDLNFHVGLDQDLLLLLAFFSCFVLFVWVFFLDQDVMYLFLSSGLDAVKEAGGSDVMSEVQQ